MNAALTQAILRLLRKGGHVIDPRNGIDQVMDVAIDEGKIKDSSYRIFLGCSLLPCLVSYNFV